MKSLVSVIIPIYNTESYLDRFFSSLRLQTFSEYQIIVVYDKSTDESLSKVKSNQAQFNCPFFIIENDYKDGLGHARDVALNSGLINTKYVLFLDPDDYVEPSFLEKLVSRADQSNADITICGFKRIDERINKVVSVDMCNNKAGLSNTKDLSESIYYNSSVWNKLYKRELIKNLKFSNIKRAEDVLFNIGAFSKSQSVYLINEPLYNYMIHDGSLSTDFKYSHLKSILEYFSENLDIMNINKDFSYGVFFIRFALGSLMRIYRTNKKDYKKSQKLIRLFLSSNYGVSKIRTLAFKKSIKFGINGFFVWLYKISYQLRIQRISLWFIGFVFKYGKKEIRW